MSIAKSPNRFFYDLVAYEPGKPIEETARELGLDPKSIIKVASNENPLGPSPLAQQAMRTSKKGTDKIPSIEQLKAVHAQTHPAERTKIEHDKLQKTCRIHA